MNAEKKLADIPADSQAAVEDILPYDTWRHRLDIALVAQIDQLAKTLDNIAGGEAPSDHRAALHARKQLLPEIVARCTNLAHLAQVNGSLAAARERQSLDQEEHYLKLLKSYEELASSTTFKIGAKVLAPLKRLRAIVTGQSTSNANLAPERTSEPIPRPHGARHIDNLEFFSVDNTGTALDGYKDWVTIFHYQGKRYGSTNPSVSDAVTGIAQFNSWSPVKNKTVLELGPFEGGNSKQLLDLGAGKLVSIEANEEFFKKCELVKKQFELTRAEFIHGDCNGLLASEEFQSRYNFDTCLASGILYHMSEPLRTVDLLCRTAPEIFIWTQVASDSAPKGEWFEVLDEGHVCRARKNIYSSDKHWGGVDRYAVWLHPEDLAQAFIRRGFSIHELLNGKTHSGDFVQFFAKKI